MSYRYIIWDWNGTLLNDVSAALASVNDMLLMRGKSAIDLVYYRQCIGVPIRRFYEKVFEIENEDYDELLKQYNEGYLRHLDECTLSEGVKEVLEKFRISGCKQIIVSSSQNEQLKANVEKYGISGYFDAVLGSEDFLADSKIRRAVDYIERNGKGSTLVIGDLVHDSEMAEELGADCVLLTSGHENPELLKRSGIKLIDSISELI